MQNTPFTLTLNQQNLPEVKLNCARGAMDVGRNMYILFRNEEEQCLEAYYLHGVDNTNDILKTIAMKWYHLKLFLKAPLSYADPLLPLPDYFDAEGRCLHNFELTEVPVSETTTLAETMVEVAPGVFMRAYDAFFELDTKGRAGIILYSIAMQKFIVNKFGVDCLEIKPDVEMKFIQPVLADLVYAPVDPEEPVYQVTVNPTDGIAPFVYSTDGVTYGANNILTYDSPENNKVFIQDDAGTVAQYDLVASNWNDAVLP